MDATIQFTCPHCQSQMSFPLAAVGQQGKCGGCQQIVMIQRDSLPAVSKPPVKKTIIFAAIAVSTVGIAILCISGGLFVYFLPQGDSVTGSIADEPQLPQSSESSSFEELCNSFVSAIKSQNPEKLMAISYSPGLKNWNDYVTEITAALKKDPDTASAAERARLQNTLDSQAFKSLETQHQDAIYQSLKEHPSLRHAGYIAKFLTKGSSESNFASIVKSMTFVVKSDKASFWGRDRYFATVLVSIENVLVSIQFVACVDSDKKWWLCSDKFVVQFANSSFLQSIVEVNNREIQREVDIRDNTEDISNAQKFLAAHPVPRTRWDWFNHDPKSYKRLTEVRGVVTYDDKPLADATVVIYPDRGDGTAKPAVGKTDAQGNFSMTTTFSDGEIVDGAFEGSYRLFAGKYELMQFADDQGEPPPDGFIDLVGQMMDMMGDDLDSSPKSLINEVFSLPYSGDVAWDNKCNVGDSSSLTTINIILSSEGKGEIVGMTY